MTPSRRRWCVTLSRFRHAWRGAVLQRHKTKRCFRGKNKGAVIGTAYYAGMLRGIFHHLTFLFPSEHKWTLTLLCLVWFQKINIKRNAFLISPLCTLILQISSFCQSFLCSWNHKTHIVLRLSPLLEVIYIYTISLSRPEFILEKWTPVFACKRVNGPSFGWRMERPVVETQFWTFNCSHVVFSLRRGRRRRHNQICEFHPQQRQMQFRWNGYNPQIRTK